MKKYLNLVCFGLLALVSFTTKPNAEPANNTIRIGISIQHDSEGDCSAQEQQLCNHLIKHIGEICTTTSENVKRAFPEQTQERDAQMEQALLSNIEAFVAACNTQVKAIDSTISFALTTKDDNISLIVDCKNAQNQNEYWQSLENIVDSAAASVARQDSDNQ